MLKNIISFVLILFALSACTQKEKQEEKKNESNVTKFKISFIDSIEVREGLAPNFYWKDSSGRLQAFDDVHNKITIVNFWATWCSPCRREIPDLIAINREMAPKGVKVIGVSTDKGANVISDVDEFVRENNIDYPIVIDNGKLAEAYGNVRGLPTTFLIDEKRNVVRKFLGIRTKEFFISQIEEIIK